MKKSNFRYSEIIQEDISNFLRVAFLPEKKRKLRYVDF